MNELFKSPHCFGFATPLTVPRKELHCCWLACLAGSAICWYPLVKSSAFCFFGIVLSVMMSCSSWVGIYLKVPSMLFLKVTTIWVIRCSWVVLAAVYLVLSSNWRFRFLVVHSVWSSVVSFIFASCCSMSLGTGGLYCPKFLAFEGLLWNLFSFGSMICLPYWDDLIQGPRGAKFPCSKGWFWHNFSPWPRRPQLKQTNGRNSYLKSTKVVPSIRLPTWIPEEIGLWTLIATLIFMIIFLPGYSYNSDASIVPSKAPKLSPH